MAETYDTVIIGGGAAGFTAGIYAARDRCRALLLERVAAGGQVLNCEHIENYPGFPDGIAGYTLGPMLQQQAMKLGLTVQLADAIKAHGIDEIVCVAVNDTMVLAAWAREREATGKISMLSDGLCEFTRAIGLEQDLSSRGFGMRSKRYAMLIEDGKVTDISVMITGSITIDIANPSVLAQRCPRWCVRRMPSHWHQTTRPLKTTWIMTRS